jgi:integrase
MAWVEHTRSGYRVRVRQHGVIYTDSTHPDETLAEQRRDIVQASIQRRTRLYVPGPAPKLCEWVSIWRANHAVSVAAAARDDSLLRLHILPRFGTTRLDAIDLIAVQGFILQLRRSLAHGTVTTIVMLLRKILRDAVATRLIVADPLAGLRLHLQPTRANQPIPDQAQVFAIACRMPTLRLKALVLSAAATGMRFGELAALHPAAVNLDAGKAWVDADVGELHEVGGRRWLGPPKPPAGARLIHLPPYLVQGLAVLIAEQPDRMLFTTAQGGLLWRTNFATRIWRPACDGDPSRGSEPLWPGLTFHDLRHTHRTWMDEDEISEVVMAKRLGHRLRDVRDYYTTLTDRMAAPLLAALQSRWDTSGATW